MFYLKPVSPQPVSPPPVTKTHQVFSYSSPKHLGLSCSLTSLPIHFTSAVSPSRPSHLALASRPSLPCSACPFLWQDEQGCPLAPVGSWHMSLPCSAAAARRPLSCPRASQSPPWPTALHPSPAPGVSLCFSPLPPPQLSVLQLPELSFHSLNTPCSFPPLPSALHKLFTYLILQSTH